MISWTFENINILAMPNQKLCTVGGGIKMLMVADVGEGGVSDLLMSAKIIHI